MIKYKLLTPVTVEIFLIAINKVYDSNFGCKISFISGDLEILSSTSISATVDKIDVTVVNDNVSYNDNFRLFFVINT